MSDPTVPAVSSSPYTTAPLPNAAPPDVEPLPVVLLWNKLTSSDPTADATYRAMVPGGWIVLIQPYGLSPAMTFVPDPFHQWAPESA